MTFFAELRRRNVIRMAGLYLVGAWLIVQVAGTVLPMFGAPEWVARSLVLLLAIGFIPALVFAWVFELTPEGIKRDADITPADSLAPQTARRMDRMLLLVMALALGYFAFDKFVLAPQRDAASTAATVSSVAATAATAAATVDDRSLAVLPFANMSGKSDEDYFSDGMTEELLNVLAKVPQLQVVARTSVFQFKGQGGDVREIGRKLGVGHIVEGSIRRDGEQVRITAQLVRVSDGFHVWSETYDRRLDSVFALQDEIAARIGDALKLSLGADAMAAPRASIDPAAYDEYLRGRALLRKRADMPAAIAHLRAAVAQAPGFAAGWSSLSLTCEASFWYSRTTVADHADLLACAAEAAEQAAALDPDAAATEHALANVARSRFRYADAERHYLRAMQIDSSYPDVIEDYAETMYEVGRIDELDQAVRKLVRMDPFFIVGWTRMRDVAVLFDRRADVEEAARQAIAIAPNSRFAWLVSIEYPLAYGRADEARAALARIQASEAKGLDFVDTLLPWALGDVELTPAELASTMAEAPPGAARAYLVARRDVAAYNAYNESAGAIVQAYYFAGLYTAKPAGQAMLRDPRVKEKLVEYGFVAYWREKGWPAGCRPLGDSDFECGIAATTAP